MWCDGWAVPFTEYHSVIILQKKGNLLATEIGKRRNITREELIVHHIIQRESREREEENETIKERKGKEKTQGKKALDVFTDSDSDSDFHIDQDSDCERSVHADSETHILTHSLCL